MTVLGWLAATVFATVAPPGLSTVAAFAPDVIPKTETVRRPKLPDPDPGEIEDERPAGGEDEAGGEDGDTGFEPVVDAPSPAGVSAPPGKTTGIKVAPRRGAKVLLWVPRVILFVPRHAIDIAVHPVRLGLMAWDKSKTQKKLTDVFFTKDRKFGIYPVLFVETGFGANGGLRVVHHDLGGKGENMFLRASYGGLYKQRYEGRFGSGNRFGDRMTFTLSGTYRIVSKARFYGLGDADEGDLPADAGPIDPIDPRRAIDTRYRRDEAFGTLAADFLLTKMLSFQLAEQLRWRRFDDPSGSDDKALERVYDTSRLPGWETGQLTSYTESTLTLKTTRVTKPHLHSAIPSTGWLARGWVGAAIGTYRDPTLFLRYGADIQRFINLRRGDRVLRLRVLTDIVDGDLDRIVFADLPSLGGPTLLRGYVRDRFRGRIAGLASVEYLWNLDDNLTGFLFTDVGRVWNTIPLESGPPRAGFGGGIIAHTSRAYLARLQVATSIDGGFYLQLKFSPSWELYDD